MTLKDLRTRNSLSQEDIAIRLNLDQSTISHWETGKTVLPAKYHKLLLRIYRCSTLELADAIRDTAGAAQ